MTILRSGSTGVDLCTISDITLHYDAATGQASYTTD